MWEPRQPIEGSRKDRFRPKFCPRSECADHRTEGRAYRFIRFGHYRRKRDSNESQPRFRCSRCGSTFSIASFSTIYYMKRPELLLPVARQLNGGSAHRQIARNVGCSPSTVTRIAVRLGAHARLFQQKMLSMIDEIREDIVYDHFESFIGNQSNRHAIGTAVGSLTWLVYDIRGVRYRGALRRSQRKRPLRSKPKATKPGTYVGSIVETLNILVSKAPRGFTLVTDDHPLYKSAIRKIRAVSGLTPAIAHRSFANPDRGPGHDKEAARSRDRALFAVDLLHKIWRHSHAHHRRETIAFGRKEANAMGRSALFAVWRNFVKRVSERRPTRLTPAIKAKLTDRAWTWAEVFSERLFEGRI